MPKVIEASDIGIVLFPDHPWWYFQCPTKLIELLAMGKPVIASDLPAIRWGAGKSQAIVYMKNLSVSAFKEAVKTALNKKGIKPQKSVINKSSTSSLALRLSQMLST
jgi:glycosyltransferase involved in cell wall biosynthesis